MSSSCNTTYSLFANFEHSEQVTNEEPMGTCSSFFSGDCGKAGRKHSTTRDSQLNQGFDFYE
jgi:hypothetical protein